MLRWYRKDTATKLEKEKFIPKQSNVKNLQYDATQLVLTDKMMDKFNNFVFKFDTDQCIPMSIISKNVSELKF